MDSSKWAQQFIDEPINVTPPSAQVGAWLLTEMAKHRAEARVHRARAGRHALRAFFCWIALMSPLPHPLHVVAFVLTIVMALVTIVEIEQWIAERALARETL